MTGNQYKTSVSTRHTLSTSDAVSKFSLTLHILIFITSLVAISLFVATIPEWNANFFHTVGPIRGDWTDGLVLGPLSLALLSTLGLLFYTFIKRRYPAPTHAATAVYAIILLLLAPSLVISGVGSLFRFWQSAVVSKSGVVQCNLTNILSRQCLPVLYHLGGMQIAGIVFGSTVWLLVFITLLVHLYEQRARSLSRDMGGLRAGRGLRPFRSTTGGRGGRARTRHDLEEGHTWAGSQIRGHPSMSESNGLRPSDRARYGDRRSWSTRYQYRVASRQGGEDIMPFATPVGNYQRPGTRYM